MSSEFPPAEHNYDQTAEASEIESQAKRNKHKKMTQTREHRMNWVGFIHLRNKMEFLEFLIDGWMEVREDLNISLSRER